MTQPEGVSHVFKIGTVAQKYAAHTTAKKSMSNFPMLFHLLFKCKFSHIPMHPNSSKNDDKPNLNISSDYYETLNNGKRVKSGRLHASGHSKFSRQS